MLPGEGVEAEEEGKGATTDEGGNIHRKEGRVAAAAADAFDAIYFLSAVKREKEHAKTFPLSCFTYIHAHISSELCKIGFVIRDCQVTQD